MSEQRLHGKIALVTGAARGMGAAEARLFAAHGAHVHAADLLDDVDMVVEEIVAAGGSATAHRHDVSREASWEALMAAIAQAHGGLDVLVNNAGISGDASPIDALALADWRRVVDVNQTGSFLGIKHAVPLLRRRGGGSIVQISSTFATRGVDGLAAYSASKAAVAGLAKNAAMTYVAEGIRVNSLHPGLVDTAMVADSPVAIGELAQVTPMRRPGRPEEVAYAALFLASDEASFITGAEIYVDGGYNARGQIGVGV